MDTTPFFKMYIDIKEHHGKDKSLEDQIFVPFPSFYR